jgi:glycosyltransferase involved in cell wall biosynthesis
MNTTFGAASADIVMLGTFGVWTRGTLQSRALPLARAIVTQTELKIAIVTTPWDDPGAAGTVETRDGVSIFNTTHCRPAQMPLAVLEQAHMLRRLRPKLVHVMKPKGFGGLTAHLRAALPGSAALVVDFDDWEGDGGWNEAGGYDPLARRLFAFQERQLVRRADQVTAASTLLEERARRFRGRSRAGSVTFLPNGLERGWYDHLRQAGRAHPESDSERSVLVYSRFAEFSTEWLRGFVAALDLAVDEPASLDFIGELDDRLLGGHDLTHLHIRSHGYLPRQDLPVALARATIAVFPYEDNLINRSKQSVKLLELMASGRAIVACDVGDIARIGRDALELSPSTSPASVALTAARLLSDTSRQRELGAKAQRVACNYWIDRQVETLLGVYRRAGLACR